MELGMRGPDKLNTDTTQAIVAGMKPEQLPIPKHKLHGWTHFAGLYAGEHVAATEFVIGATFVALGATTTDILIGLLIGNILAVLSWTLITAPIAVQTRLSLYTYLEKIAGDSMTSLYNWANVLIFTVISAAMITVSSSAVRLLFNIPAQLEWYPTNSLFVAVVLAVGAIVVVVAMYGFDAVAEFSGLCGPWLVVMFVSGALVLFPALAQSVLGRMRLDSLGEFITIGDRSIWTGVNSQGEPGIGLLEVIGFAWAANTLTHFGLIDMALLRYAKRSVYGLCSSAGMLFGHYIAWIAAGIMGAGTAVLLKSTIAELDPGDVAFRALGYSGYVIVIVAGWTTANANLYRAGLAAQAIAEGQPAIDKTVLSKVLGGLAWTSIGLSLVLALIVMFGSPDKITYDRNAAIFHTWAFVFTIVYFTASYWALHRSKTVQYEAVTATSNAGIH